MCHHVIGTRLTAAAATTTTDYNDDDNYNIEYFLRYTGWFSIRLGQN